MMATPLDGDSRLSNQVSITTDWAGRQALSGGGFFVGGGRSTIDLLPYGSSATEHPSCIAGETSTLCTSASAIVQYELNAVQSRETASSRDLPTFTAQNSEDDHERAIENMEADNENTPHLLFLD